MTAPEAIRVRSVVAAFLRMDFAEDTAYPLWLVIHHLGLIVPVFIYYFVSALVGDAPTVGGDYFTFATIGLAVTTALQGSLSGLVWSMSRAQDRGTFEAMLVEPIPWRALPLAMGLWRTLLGTGSGLVVFVLGLVLGAHYVAAGVPALLLVIVLGMAASMAIGILGAALMVLSKRGEPVLVLYGIAASVFAGALFSVDQLPRALQMISWALPHTYVVNAARGVMMTDPGTFTIPLGGAVLALSLFTVVVGAIGVWVLGGALRYSRRMGYLSGY